MKLKVGKTGEFFDRRSRFLIGPFQTKCSSRVGIYGSIAEMIREGTNNATKMNAALISQRGWNRSKASVYRTGVLARMQEFGLVNREKSGVEVTFVLTELGKERLQQK